jgi:hypothetical protein
VRLAEQAAPALRELHGSGGIRTTFHCFRIVFSIRLFPQPCIFVWLLASHEVPGVPHSQPAAEASPAGAPSFWRNECAPRSWRDPAGGSPAQVRRSEPPGSECCVSRR